MILLHTSDWHLGAMDGDRSLLKDQEFFINAICDVIRDYCVDAVIIAGDIYDRSVSSAEAIKLYDYAMTRICSELKVPVIIIAGNHDSAERLSSCRELLAPAGLYISGSLEKEISKVSFEDADIYLLPWITEEKVKSVFTDKKDSVDSLEAAYRTVTDCIKAGFDANKKHMIVSHAFISDSETSTSDRAAEIGFASQVSAEVFDGFDYVALGHIHKPQNVTDKIRYSGTPMPYSFGKEEKQEKSVTIINTSDMKQQVVCLPLLHRRNTIVGTLNELLDFDGPDEIKNGYVRLQVTDQYIGLEALSELRKVFPNILEASGKSFEGENASITLTMDELEKLESDPVEVFKHFCMEEINIEPDGHLLDLFKAAISAEEGTE